MCIGARDASYLHVDERKIGLAWRGLTGRVCSHQECTTGNSLRYLQAVARKEKASITSCLFRKLVIGKLFNSLLRFQD